MKKSLKATITGLALAVTLTATAGAANFTDCADKLNSMDLFSGTAIGYELDRAPTRAEASVMLVRLLGGAKEAEATTFETPFTDVPTWAAPYVGWLYENELTAGTSQTTFDPNSKCTAQMYSAFLLRTLGYNEVAGDFTYAKATDFATDKGVADFINCDATNFLRDHVAAMSYTALSTQPKDQKNTTLLDQLVAEGAIDATKAAPVQSGFTTFREYNKLVTAANAQSKVAMNMAIDAKVLLNGVSFMDMKMDLDVAADMDAKNMNSSKMSMVGTMDASINEAMVQDPAEADLSTDLAYYYTDGNFYMNMGGTKIKTPLDFDEAIAEAMGEMDMTQAQSNPISFYKSLVKSSDGSFTAVYSTDSMSGMIDQMFATMEMTDVQMKFNKLDSTEKIDKNGNMSSMNMDMDVDMTTQGQTMKMTMKMACKVTATGNSVKVTLPTDLDTYVLEVQ